MSKSKKFSTILIGFLLAVATSATAAFSFAAAESEAVDVKLLYEPDGTRYAYLDTPTSIASTQTELYIAEKNGIRSFSLSGTETGTLDFPATDRAFLRNGLTVTLQSGELATCFGETKTQVTSGISDFSVYEQTLYAYKIADGSTEILRYTVTDNGLTDEQSYTLHDTVVTALAAADGKAFLSVRVNRTGTRDAVCMFLPDAPNALGPKTERAAVRRLLADRNFVYVLGDNGIERFRLLGDTLIGETTLSVSDVIDLTAADGNLYALTGAASVLKIDGDLSGYSELLASASAQKGFFNAPYTSVTRKNRVIVPDYYNNRVAVYVDTQISYIDYPFVYPTSAAIDDDGRIYIGHRVNSLDVFNENGGHLYCVDCGDTHVIDLYTDSSDRILVRTDDGISELVDRKLQALYTGAVSAVAVMPESKHVYIYAAGAVSRIENGQPVKLADIPFDVVDFAVDIERSLYFLLRDGNVVKYVAADGYVAQAAKTDYGGYGVTDGARRLTVSSIRNSSVDYGDLLITDTKAHTVKVLPAASLDVKIIDDTVVPPVVVDNDVANAIAERSIVYVAREDISVYPLPRDMSPFATVEKGKKILVPQHDLSDNDAFSFVLIEDHTNKKLVSGYVRKQRLPEETRLLYVAPPAALGTVQNDNTVVYKWPSIYATHIGGSFGKGTDVKLLDFVAGFVDDNGFRWYRIETGNGTGEGYIYAANLSINHYQPIFIRPQYNATVIKTPAPLYLVDENGAYVVIGNESPLPVGTRVEVIGVFDPSATYTHVKYFNEELGTLECYVQTEYLKYNGVTALQIIVSVLIAVVIIVLIVVIVHHFTVRRRKTANKD